MTATISKVKGINIASINKFNNALRTSISKINGVNRTSTLLTGIVHYWKFDETTGTTLDDAVGTYDLTAQSGATVNQTGIIGKAVHYDGSTNGYAEDTSVSMPTTSGTLSAWFNIDAWVEEGVIFTNGLYASPISWVCYLRTPVATKVVRFVFDQDGVWGGTLLILDGTTALENGRWYQVVVTWERGSVNTAKLYLNGVEEDSEALSFDPYASATTIRTGGMTGFNWFHGLIDEIGVWDRALTPSEVTELYNKTSGITYPF